MFPWLDGLGEVLEGMRLKKGQKSSSNFLQISIIANGLLGRNTPFFSNIACWSALMLSEQWWESRTSYWGQGLFLKKMEIICLRECILCFSSELWIEAPAAPKCGTWTSNISITQKPAGDAGSWALFQTYNIRISRDLWFNKLLNNSYVHSHFKTTKEHPKIISRNLTPSWKEKEAVLFL